MLPEKLPNVSRVGYTENTGTERNQQEPSGTGDHPHQPHPEWLPPQREQKENSMTITPTITAIAQHLATDKGKATYRNAYNEYLPTWIAEYEDEENGIQYARGNAKSDALSAVMDELGIYDNEITSRICEGAQYLDARSWSRSKDANKIEARLRENYGLTHSAHI